MEYLAKSIVDVVFLIKEVLATWVTEGLDLTAGGEALISQVVSIVNNLSVIVSDLINSFLASLPMGPML